MARKNKEEIQPIEASFDDVSNAIVVSAVVNKTPLQAIRKGNFQKNFGFDCDCYVLNDAKHTAVISKRGMATALGLSKSGSAITRLVKGKSIVAVAGEELVEKINNPLIFNVNTPGENEPSYVAHGYDVTILIDICRAIIEAREKDALTEQQKHIVKQAQIIINASAKSGIQGLVYALTGYDVTKEEVIRAFKSFVREEARDYEKEFPDMLYEAWYRLYQIEKPKRNHSWKMMHLTVNHVYMPLANSNGKILQLTRILKRNGGNNKVKLHQFLNEIGVKALRQHLGQLLGIARISETQEEYEAHFNKIFGTQLLFNFEKEIEQK